MRGNPKTDPLNHPHVNVIHVSQASSGVRLNRYYVDTVCSPTRATFMSGRYPIHNGINDYIHPATNWGLPLNETTLATLMQRSGYSTHAIGKVSLRWSMAAPS